MKIKKIYQGTLPENKILNNDSTSQTDTYSCDYINNTLETELSTKQDKLTAGENITITDNVISATGGENIEDRILNTESTSQTDTYSCDYINNLISGVEDQIKPPTTVSLTGNQLNAAIKNNTLNTGDSIICTESYRDGTTEYVKGHTYIVKEKLRGEVSVANQLRELGFTVDEIESSLENNEIKYFYIANFVNSNIDGLSSSCAYSKVPLDTSDSEFPSTGWKTFSVSRKSTSDPNFYYADGSIYEGNDNMVLDTMLLLSDSTNNGNWHTVQHSSELLATYTNDPDATAFDYYSANPNDTIRYVEDITTETLNVYYTKNEIDNTVGDIETLLGGI